MPISDHFFHDFSAKANYTLGAKDQVFATGYLGRNVFGFSGFSDLQANFSWGNTLGTLRWQHPFSPTLTANSQVGLTSYQYNLGSAFDIVSFGLTSTIRDYKARVDFNYQPHPAHYVRFGASATRHAFGVGRLQVETNDNSLAIDNDSCCTTPKRTSRTAEPATATTMPRLKTDQRFCCLWSRLKTELLELRDWPVFTDLADTPTSVANYFDYYSYKRHHSSIGYLKPYHFHQQLLANIT